MDKIEPKHLLMGLAATTAAFLALRAFSASSTNQDDEEGGDSSSPAMIEMVKLKSKINSKDAFVAIAGDVGGTNVRLELVRLYRNSSKADILIPLTKYDAQKTSGMEECIKEFLKDIPKGSSRYPEIAVVGMAGALVDNVF